MDGATPSEIGGHLGGHHGFGGLFGFGCHLGFGGHFGFAAIMDGGHAI